MQRIRARRVTVPFSAKQPRSRYLWHLCAINELFKLETFLTGGLYLSARIRTAIEPLIQLGAAHFGRVAYIDHDSHFISKKNILYAHFVVRSEFEEEQEARVLLHTHGFAGHQLVNFRGPKGPLVRIRKTKTNPSKREYVGGFKRGIAVLLGIDPQQFIDEILVGRAVQESRFRELSKRTADAGLTCRRQR